MSAQVARRHARPLGGLAGRHRGAATHASRPSRLRVPPSWLAIALATCAAGCWEVPPRWWDADGGGARCDGGVCCDGGCCDDGGCPSTTCDGALVCSAPDADVGMPRPRERTCDDGLDNDGDGAPDCADFDCADHAACCAGGALLFQEDWSGADLTFLWDHLPSGAPTTSPAREDEGDSTMLQGWDDDEPHALVWNRCIPLAQGAELSFDAVATARPAVCAAWHEPCDEHAAVLLSPVRDTLPGQPLLEDLAIRVHGDARVNTGGGQTVLNQAMVRVTQAGAELGRVLIDPEVRYRVTLRVTPSTHQGQASLRADVEVRRADATPDELSQTVGGFFIRDQATLERNASGCLEVGGLYAGVEMVGDAGARLGSLRAATLACANPSQFQDAPDGTTTLTSGSLGVPASYGGAHIGAPALGSSFNSAFDPLPRWDLFFEASNDPPELALVAPVGYAIAHANSATFGALAADWSTSATPRLGADPPSCLVSGGTCAGPSVRDPFLLVERDVNDLLQGFVLAFAQRLPTGAHELRIEQDVSFSPSVPLGGQGVSVLQPSADCVDLRDPALLPVPGGTGGYWLFFTCVPDGGSSELRALRLKNDFSQQGTAAVRVLAPAALGELGGGGLLGPEPLLRSTPMGVTLQLWFVARDPTGQTALALATGQLPPTDTPDGGVPAPPALDTLPPLEPYVANPVLRSEDGVLGACPGLCRITGAAVSDTAGNPDELRFVVARRVVHPNGSLSSELRPLTQLWRTP